MAVTKQVEASLNLKDIDDQVSAIRATLVTERNRLIGSFRENPNPQSMVGFVKDFRFRMGDVNENPRYTFKLDTGLGMVLWVSCFTDVMTPLLRGMKGKDNLAKSINGKMMKVVAASSGPVPSQMLDHLPNANDYYGAPLYKEARIIRYSDGQPGTILRANSSDETLLYINYDNFDEPETSSYGYDLIRL